MTEIAFALVYIGLLATTAGHIYLTQGSSHQSVTVAKIIFGTNFFRYQYKSFYRYHILPVLVLFSVLNLAGTGSTVFLVPNFSGTGSSTT